MNWLQKAAEAVGSLWSPDWYNRNGFYRLAQLVGSGTSTSAGIPVNVERAMQCSIPYVCTRAICEPLSAMPLPVLQKTGENTAILRDSMLHGLLNRNANDFQTAKLFRRTLQHHALNHGNGFAHVLRRGASREPFALYIKHPSTFVKKDIEQNEAVFIFRENGRDVPYGGKDIFHLMSYSDDGMVGIGAVESGREAIGRAIAIERFASTFFGRGGLKAGLIKKTAPFKSESDLKRWEEEYKAKYRNGVDSFHANLLLQGEWDWQGIGSDPSESQLVEAFAAMVAEICRFYGLTPHLAQDLSRAHFANVEHLWIEYINITLGPWMVAWEQEAHRVLLTKEQRDAGVYVKHTTAAFMRGDFEARMRAYSTMLQNGLASINEVRALEDWDPVSGGDAHHIQLNMQTVPGTGKPTASELAAIRKAEPKQPQQKSDINTILSVSTPPGEKKQHWEFERDGDGNVKTAILKKEA